MKAFRENNGNGKLSIRRIVGVIGGIISFVMYILKAFIELPHISDTLLIGMFTASIGLLASTAVSHYMNRHNPEQYEG